MEDDSQEQLKAYKEIYEFAAKNISESRESFERHYKFTATAMLFLASVIIAVFYWFVGKEYKDIAATVQVKADTHFAELDSEIRSRISAQFAEKRMHSLIEQVAVEQTKKGLAEVISQAVSRSVESRVKAEEPQIQKTVIEETKKGVDALSPTIASAVEKQSKSAEERLQTHIGQYETVIQASTLAVLARNGDGIAYDRLTVMARTSTNQDVASLAITTRNQLYMEYDMQKSAIYLTRQFKEAKTKDQLKALLSDRDPLTRKAAVDSLVAQGDKTVVPLLIPILEHDAFIFNRIASYRGLSMLTAQEIEPLNVDAWNAWWLKNGANWPK